MNAPSVGAELRRYRAIAWVLVATLIVSVGLFVQFLRMDSVRVADAFASSAEHAATNSSVRITRLVERLKAIGRGYLLGVNDTQLLSLAGALDVDATLASLCAHEGDTVRALRATTGAPDTAGRRDCAAELPSLQIPVKRRDEDSPLQALGIIESPPGDAPSLEFRMRHDDSRELRMTLSSTALLDALVLGNAGLDIDHATVCLSIRTEETFRDLTCHVGKTVAALPEAFRTTGGKAPWIEEIEVAGLHWRVAVMPGPRSLAGKITLLPFAMFGIALAIGSAACVFTYRAVDKNILLETRADELRMRLEQLERLEEQNGLLDQFAAMAAHDLQAPIRFIVSNAHLLHAELDEMDRDDLSRMAMTQVEQGERMRALVLDLLEFCRAGQSKLTITSVDARALVDAEVCLLKAHGEYAGTRIVVGPLPDALMCDADRLAHVVRNLLGNAVKFSQGRSAPKVSISASRDTLHGAWTFRVKDNGPGVDEKHHERIFRPFARLESSTPGTGMGLAIVRIMLERHGGTIWIDPAETEGSTFCFTIPGSIPEGDS